MSQDEKLVGRPIAIRANDFVNVVLHGRIESVEATTKSILIALNEPVVIGESKYERVIASARLVRDDLAALATKGTLGCGVTWIPVAKYNARRPFDLSWWRGGGAAIADVLLQ